MTEAKKNWRARLAVEDHQLAESKLKFQVWLRRAKRRLWWRSQLNMTQSISPMNNTRDTICSIRFINEVSNSVAKFHSPPIQDSNLTVLAQAARNN